MLITARFLAAASEKQQVRRSVATPPPVLFASGRLWRACSSEELGARAKLYSPHRSQHQPASIQLHCSTPTSPTTEEESDEPKPIGTERVRAKHPIRGGRCPRVPVRSQSTWRRACRTLSTRRSKSRREAAAQRRAHDSEMRRKSIDERAARVLASRLLLQNGQN